MLAGGTAMRLASVLVGGAAGLACHVDRSSTRTPVAEGPTRNVSAPPAAVPDPAPALTGAAIFEECRARVAKRFRPNPGWEKPWTKGPADRSPSGGCDHAWMDGSPPNATALSPGECQDARGGWAGIGLLLASEAVDVSDDGSMLLRCAGNCAFVRVKDGAILARVESEGLDGEPVEEKPEVRAAKAKLGFRSSASPWPVPDAFLDWSLAPRGSAVTYWLRDRVTRARLPVGRFQSSDEYVFPMSATWSRNGLILVLRAQTRPQGQGVELKCVFRPMVITRFTPS